MADAVGWTILPCVPAPAPDVFRRNYVRRRRPAVFTGLAAADGWSVERLLARYGDRRVVAVAQPPGGLRADADPPPFQQVRLADVVGSPRWFVQTPADMLLRDVPPPPHCRDAWTLRSKLWIARAGAVTPLHWDIPQNLHLVIAGRKRVVLAPPGAWWRLYPRSPLSAMPNFARVDLERPDLARHPRAAGVRAVACEVGPGDTLFIPAGWWHHTRWLEDGVSVNWWFGGRAIALAALASAIWKRLRGIYPDEWGAPAPAGARE
jgi:hypothetical protein